MKDMTRAQKKIEPLPLFDGAAEQRKPTDADKQRMREESQAAAREAIAQAEAHANEAWKALMYKLLREICLTMRRFTADDVFELYDRQLSPPVTHENRAFGAVMQYGKKQGWCRKTGDYEATRRKNMHACPRAVWESLL